MTARYGGDRIKKGLSRFFLGKGLSSLFGLVAMFIIVRALSIEDFARYSVLVALIEVFSAVSGFGLAHVINRYVPELYVEGRIDALRRLIEFAIVARTVLLGLILSLAYLYTDHVSSWVGLGATTDVFKIYLLVVFFRSLGHHLTFVVESTLHQGISQVAYTSSAIVKFCGVAFIFYCSLLNLKAVIILEVFCDALSAFVLLYGVVTIFLENSGIKNSSIKGDECRQIIRFSISAYMQHLATLPFGGNTNRLLGGSMFGSSVMAGFGFSQTLYEYFKRYLPTQFLVGFIRPVVISRYVSLRDFSSVSRLCDQSVQINVSILSGVLAVLSVVGEESLLWLSGGKYGADSVALLSVMLVLLALETYRVVLELLAQTVERYDILIFGNLLLSCSVVGGVFGYEFIGAVAFPVSNLLALLFVNFLVVKKLSLLGYFFKSDRRELFISLLMFAVPMLCGKIFRLLTDVHWVFAGLLTLFVYSVLFCRLKLNSSKIFFRELVGC